MPALAAAIALHPEITALRRRLHEHPELLYDVTWTAGVVAEELRAMGCDEVVTGIGRTGVVGIIRGRGVGDHVVGLRADMDALPLEEMTNLPYRSKIPGKMHACGHDGHTAMLIGAARVLCQSRAFAGTVAVIFQPAEEGGGGGRAMVQDGLMERFGIREVYGLHNMPGIPVGQFAIRPGPMMAAADRFDLIVEGKGGHAAKPHECIDTILVASQIIVALQSIAARNADPLDSVVVSTCMVKAGETYNVIPQTAHLKGTVRTLKPETRVMARQRIEAIVHGVAQAMGATVRLDYELGYPVTVNDEAKTAFCAEVAREVAGDVDLSVPPVMGAEDFSFMLEERPGAYIFMGNGDTAMVHHPAYDFNDAAIPAGVSYLVRLAERAMPLA